ncbi:MAG: MFS transporter [bacterium]|nr:MFS transporter [bacterium]
MKRSLASLGLHEYYALEGAHSLACTLFTTCVMFWTERRYGYSSAWNLWLNAVQGLAYVVSSWVGGMLADRLGYDRQLRVAIVAAGVLLLCGWLPAWRGTPFVVTTLYALTMGATWPALEAVILHAPGRLTMPQRMGIYNVMWAVVGAVGVFGSAPLFALRPSVVFWLPGVLHAGEALYMWVRRGRGGEGVGLTAMELPHRGNHVAFLLKRRLLYTAWVANAVGYMLCAAFVAVAPFVGQRLGLSVRDAIWLVSVYLIARGVGFVLFWRWEGWHYHVVWNVAAAIVGPASMAVVLLISHAGAAVVALAMFGLAHSMSYAGSLYYSVDRGEEKGAHSGLHEAILGLGIFAGPLAGAAGAALWRAPFAAEVTVLTMAFCATIAGLGWIYTARRE